MTPDPCIGMDVWFHPNDTTTRAAKITALHPEKPGVVSLAIFGLTEMNFRQDIPQSEGPKAGHWSFVG